MYSWKWVITAYNFRHSLEDAACAWNLKKAIPLLWIRKMMCGWSESNQWYLSDLSFWIIYSKCSLPGTVIYRGCFKHYSGHVEGPQLDQEEITSDRLSALARRLTAGAQRLGGTATMHVFTLLSIKMLTAMDEPSFNQVGKERSPFSRRFILISQSLSIVNRKVWR